MGNKVSGIWIAIHVILHKCYYVNFCDKKKLTRCQAASSLINPLYTTGTKRMTDLKKLNYSETNFSDCINLNFLIIWFVALQLHTGHSFSELFKTKYVLQNLYNVLTHSLLQRPQPYCTCRLKCLLHLSITELWKVSDGFANVHSTDCNGRLSTFILFTLSPHCSTFCSVPAPMSLPHPGLCWEAETERYLLCWEKEWNKAGWAEMFALYYLTQCLKTVGLASDTAQKKGTAL